MNAKRAKALRREVYGDLSLRSPRRYAVTRENDRTVFNHPDSLRACYQVAKRGFGARSATP